MHLCTISIDRYLSLRYPMRFGRNKTRKRVTVKIIFVWLLSIAMSLPLCLMYSKVSPFITYNIFLFVHANFPYPRIIISQKVFESSGYFIHVAEMKQISLTQVSIICNYVYHIMLN